MTWSEYVLKCRGYIRKIEKEKEVFRFAVWNIINPHVEKMPPKERFWPLSTDKIETPEQMAKRISSKLNRVRNK